MNNTPNYGYNLPEYLEDADVVILNQNFTAIDKDILDVRQIAVLMYDSDEHYDTDDLVGYENPTDHHIRMFRCLEDNVTGVWDSTKWTNTNVAAELLRRSGGGTEVEANPSGSATDYLTKVKIGNTIYAVTPADMTGATSQAAGAHGLVPAPSAGDDGKVLYGDGTWKTPQSAPSNLGDLGDVTLTTPTEGQILAYDGDEWVNTDAPDVDVTKTASGNPIEINDGANAPLVKCVSAITGSQDLHGYDKPWVGGAGKNKLKVTVDGIKSANGGASSWTGNSKTINSCTWTIETDSAGNVTGLRANTNGSALVNQSILYLDEFTGLSGDFLLSGGLTNSVYITIRLNAEWSQIYSYSKTQGTQVSFTSTDSLQFVLAVNANQTVNDIFLPMLRLEQGTDSSFEQWENKSPITAYTEGEIEVSDGDGNTTTHTTTYPSAIYRGSEDVVNGSVEADKVKLVFDGTETWYSDARWPGLYYTINIINNYPTPVSGGYGNECLCNMYVGAVRSGINQYVAGEFAFCHSTITGSASSILFKTNYATVEEFKASISGGLEVIVPLGTPTTSSVTPTNLPIRTLSGYTHIESSTGDMEIEYITGKYQPIVDLISESSGGDSQHHYSTDEQVVGTWIDGSTLYEKTIEVTQSLTAGGDNLIAINVNNFGKLINVHGSATCAGIPNLPIPMMSSSLISYIINPYSVDANGYMHLEVGTIYTGNNILQDITITIRYTKTSTRSLSKGTTEKIEEKPVEEEKKEVDEKSEELTKEVDELLDEQKEELTKEPLEPISEPLETKTDSLSKDETELKEEDESKEIEEVTEEPTEVTEEEPVDPEPSKEETDER